MQGINNTFEKYRNTFEKYRSTVYLMYDLIISAIVRRKIIVKNIIQQFPCLLMQKKKRRWESALKNNCPPLPLEKALDLVSICDKTLCINIPH